MVDYGHDVGNGQDVDYIEVRKHVCNLDNDTHPTVHIIDDEAQLRGPPAC